MQKVIRYTSLARRQADRKAKIAKARINYADRHEVVKDQIQARRQFLDDVNTERKTRREDWMKGPLAPRRDVGDREGLYGTISGERTRAPAIPKEKQKSLVFLAAGDRVCVIRGRDKGRIGNVGSVDKESDTLTISGINTYDVEFPAFMLKGEADRRPFRPSPLPVRIDDVRLVVALRNHETGQMRDVIVERMVRGANIEREPGVELPPYARHIAGSGNEIPWPEAYPAEIVDEDVDTLRIEVETNTFFPSLEAYPMPPSVIDEVRNKYSRMRMRHDPEYVEKKHAQDARELWAKNRRLVSPKTEYMQRIVEERQRERQAMTDEKGNPIMSDETASFVNAFLAAKQQQHRAS
ncbi:hypothetical protein AJ80_00765 [Polytolypa hystricis UAMH7299]|uniref:KOW domain-containing protein n=1 Tax=Polytolypa hystricis (strain UAMH7299) TaxID=1447883 RepID=A0A2B7YTZ9_POLH7|nr:hypothetical protein AJ80_00765 [Polytolypa hystricis UAMH7299]